MKAKLIPGQYIDNARDPFGSPVSAYPASPSVPTPFHAADLTAYPDVPIRRGREINASLNNYDVFAGHAAVRRDDTQDSSSRDA